MSEDEATEAGRAAIVDEHEGSNPLLKQPWPREQTTAEYVRLRNAWVVTLHEWPSSSGYFLIYVDAQSGEVEGWGDEFVN